MSDDDVVTWTELASRALTRAGLGNANTIAQTEAMWALAKICASSSPPIDPNASERAMREVLGWKAGESTLETAKRVVAERDAHLTELRAFNERIANLKHNWAAADTADRETLDATDNESRVDAIKRVVKERHDIASRERLYRDSLADVMRILGGAEGECSDEVAARVVKERDEALKKLEPFERHEHACGYRDAQLVAEAKVKEVETILYAMETEDARDAARRIMRELDNRLEAINERHAKLVEVADKLAATRRDRDAVIKDREEAIATSNRNANLANARTKERDEWHAKFDRLTHHHDTIVARMRGVMNGCDLAEAP